MTRVLHCWMGRLEHTDAMYGWRSAEYQRIGHEEPNGTCLLPDGHDGPHEFTDDDKIVVSFPAPGQERA